MAKADNGVPEVNTAKVYQFPVETDHALDIAFAHHTIAYALDRAVDRLGSPEPLNFYERKILHDLLAQAIDAAKSLGIIKEERL